jgi:hypothetical protein
MVRHNYIRFLGIQLLLLLFAVTAARAAPEFFAVGGMSAEAKLSDDRSGLRFLADNELGPSRRAPVEYVLGDEIPSDSTAPLSTLAANQSDDQVDSYYADDGLMAVAATGLAVILLGGLALVGSALRRREAWQAGRPEGWRAELMESLEDDLANFAVVMQEVPSQPERSRPIGSRPAEAHQSGVDQRKPKRSRKWGRMKSWSRRMSRSNSATTASIPAKARSLGVVRSRASLSETNPTFSAVSSLQGGDEIDERLAPAIESP